MEELLSVIIEHGIEINMINKPSRCRGQYQYRISSTD